MSSTYRQSQQTAVLDGQLIDTAICHCWKFHMEKLGVVANITIKLGLDDPTVSS